jgi:hypothetical protein
VLISGAAITSVAGIWDGNRLQSKLRVYLDAGAGDAFHVFRYARYLAEQGASFVARPSMIELFRYSLPGIAIQDKHPLEPAMQHITSLGLLKMATKDQLPRFVAKPYLRAWAPLKLSRTTWPLHVGLCAKGDKTQAFDKWRSIHDPRPFAVFNNISGIAWWTLDDPSLFRDWTDTANLIAGLDLVITVDTGVAHLAGALGVPVFLMDRAPGPGDWGPDDRWDEGYLQAGPLYEKVTVFKQKARGSWTDVIDAVRNQLIARIAK